jgi:addiction module HigA family antidote
MVYERESRSNRTFLQRIPHRRRRRPGTPCRRREAPAVHPGEVLLKEFLRPLCITAYRLAKDIRMSQSSIAQLVRKKRTITPRTAVRLSQYFGNPAEFWLILQNDYDLEKRRAALRKELESI